MLKLEQIASRTLNNQPFAWAKIDGLYSPEDAAALAATYPHDHFKIVEGYGGEKDYHYEARALIAMGANTIAHPEALSESWLRLARDLLSPEYRAAMSALTGHDLSRNAMEVNVFHYGPGSHLGPHLDLKDKLVTHILYFNPSWRREDGGCLAVLNSADARDVADVVEPVVGNSAVLVRSENSWHEVTRVVNGCRQSRRSMTVTFYHPGSVSSMWPPEDTTPLRDYVPAAAA